MQPCAVGGGSRCARRDRSGRGERGAAAGELRSAGAHRRCGPDQTTLSLGAGFLVLIAFYQRYPHGAGFLAYLYMGKELFYFEHIGIGRNRSFCAEHAYMPGFGIIADHFCRRPYYTEHSFAGGDFFQVVLLYGPEGFCGGGIAGQYHQRASLVKEPLHCFQRVLVHLLEAPGAVGRTCIVAHVQVIVLGKLCGDLF